MIRYRIRFAAPDGVLSISAHVPARTPHPRSGADLDLKNALAVVLPAAVIFMGDPSAGSVTYGAGNSGTFMDLDIESLAMLVPEQSYPCERQGRGGYRGSWQASSGSRCSLTKTPENVILGPVRAELLTVFDDVNGFEGQPDGAVWKLQLQIIDRGPSDEEQGGRSNE